MIRFEFGAADLAGLRVAHSPIDYAHKTGEWTLDGHDLALLPAGRSGRRLLYQRTALGDSLGTPGR